MAPYNSKEPINVTVTKIKIPTGATDTCHNPVATQGNINNYIFMEKKEWADGHKRYSFFSEDPRKNPKAKYCDLLFDIQNLIDDILYHTPYRHAFVRLEPVEKTDAV